MKNLKALIDNRDVTINDKKALAAKVAKTYNVEIKLGSCDSHAKIDKAISALIKDVVKAANEMRKGTPTVISILGENKVRRVYVHKGAKIALWRNHWWNVVQSKRNVNTLGVLVK